MIPLDNKTLYKRFRNTLIFRLCITIGLIVYWLITSLNDTSLSTDNPLILLIGSNILIPVMFFFSFRYANKNKESYLKGDFKMRIENYMKFTMYRFSVLEISPFLLMAGFITMGKIYFAIEAILLYILLVIYFPTKKRLSKELNLQIE